MSGATSNQAISSLVQQCQFIEEQTQQALVKAFRAATGQFNLTDVVVNNSTTLTTATDLSFPVKANFKYIMYGDMLFNVWAGAGPLGNLKFQFTAPGHTNNFFANGQAAYTISGSASTVLMLGTAANSPYAAPQIPSIQTFNSPIISANSATAAYSAQLAFVAEIIPTVDDLVTVQIAQAAASATGSTICQRGSYMNVLGLAQSRRAPNVV